MRCNCENLHCSACLGKGCTLEAGARRAMYVGRLCDPCADQMPPDYMISDYMMQARQVYLEHEVLWRGDHVMLEATRCYYLLGPFDDEGMRYDACNPIYLFRVFKYNELTQNYEIPIADQLSEYDNIEFQRILWELDADQAASAAEARYDRD